MDITRLEPAAYRRTPWKNGGGVTIDIADAYAPGATVGGWSAMRWRFGRTQILAPGPFSDLSGYDRILTVIGGRGLVLEIAGGQALDGRRPFPPGRLSRGGCNPEQLGARPRAQLYMIRDGAPPSHVTVLGAR